MIDYTRPWHALDIDVSNAVRSDFDFDTLLLQSPYANDPAAMWNFKDDTLTDLLEQQWLNYFRSLGFAIRNVLLFYRAPEYVHNVAHIDYVGTESPVPAIYALNFVASPDDDSEMVWYQHCGTSGNRGTDAANQNPQNHYEFWPMETIVNKEISRRCIGNKMTLVSTGHIHNVVMGKQQRWAVSIRLVPNTGINSWSDAVGYFSHFIKESD